MPSLLHPPRHRNSKATSQPLYEAPDSQLAAYPSLYQINTRVLLTDLSRSLAGLPHWTTFLTRNWIELPSRASTGYGFSASGRPDRGSKGFAGKPRMAP